MNSTDWLTETPDSRGTRFLIKHKRSLVLKAVWICWIAFVVCCVLTVAFGIYSDHSPHDPDHMGSAVGVLVFALGAVLLILVAILVTVLLLPVYLKMRDFTEFVVGPDAVWLLQKMSSKLPDMAPRDHISEYFVITPQGRDPQLTITVTATVYRGGLAGAVQQGTGIATNTAADIVKTVLKAIGYGVAINYRGSNITLTWGITQPEVDYLFSRLKVALAAQAPAVVTQAVATAAPTSPFAIPIPPPAVSAGTGENSKLVRQAVLVGVAVVLVAGYFYFRSGSPTSTTASSGAVRHASDNYTKLVYPLSFDLAGAGGAPCILPEGTKVKLEAWGGSDTLQSGFATLPEGECPMVRIRRIRIFSGKQVIDGPESARIDAGSFYVTRTRQRVIRGAGSNKCDVPQGTQVLLKKSVLSGPMRQQQYARVTLPDGMCPSWGEWITFPWAELDGV